MGGEGPLPQGGSLICDSPSGRKLLEPRNGEHMMAEAGAARGQSGPLCQPGSRQAAGPWGLTQWKKKPQPRPGCPLPSYPSGRRARCH